MKWTVSCFALTVTMKTRENATAAVTGYGVTMMREMTISHSALTAVKIITPSAMTAAVLYTMMMPATLMTMTMPTAAAAMSAEAEATSTATATSLTLSFTEILICTWA